MYLFNYLSRFLSVCPFCLSLSIHLVIYRSIYLHHFYLHTYLFIFSLSVFLSKNTYNDRYIVVCLSFLVMNSPVSVNTTLLPVEKEVDIPWPGALLREWLRAVVVIGEIRLFLCAVTINVNVKMPYEPCC